MTLSRTDVRTWQKQTCHPEGGVRFLTRRGHRALLIYIKTSNAGPD
jgi:hypothetical protein